MTTTMMMMTMDRAKQSKAKQRCSFFLSFSLSLSSLRSCLCTSKDSRSSGLKMIAGRLPFVLVSSSSSAKSSTLFQINYYHILKNRSRQTRSASFSKIMREENIWSYCHMHGHNVQCQFQSRDMRLCMDMCFNR